MESGGRSRLTCRLRGEFRLAPAHRSSSRGHLLRLMKQPRRCTRGAVRLGSQAAKASKNIITPGRIASDVIPARPILGLENAGRELLTSSAAPRDKHRLMAQTRRVPCLHEHSSGKHANYHAMYLACSPNEGRPAATFALECAPFWPKVRWAGGPPNHLSSTQQSPCETEDIEACCDFWSFDPL